MDEPTMNWPEPDELSTIKGKLMNAETEIYALKQRVAELERRAEDAELIAWGLANQMRVLSGHAAILDSTPRLIQGRASEYHNDNDLAPYVINLVGSYIWLLRYADTDKEVRRLYLGLTDMPGLTDAAREILSRAREGE